MLINGCKNVRQVDGGRSSHGASFLDKWVQSLMFSFSAFHHTACSPLFANLLVNGWSVHVHSRTL